MIGLVRVLAHLHDSEQSEALHAQHSVDLRVDLESHGATRLLQDLELVLQDSVLLVRVRIIDPGVQDGPVGA